MKKYLRKFFWALMILVMILGNLSISFAEIPDDVIDYSHEPLKGWGYSLALSGNEYRYQTFTATKDGMMEAVEVAVYKKNQVSAGFIDLKAALFEVEDGKPVGDPLNESLVKTGDQVNSATPGAETVTEDMVTRFDLNYNLVAGKQYAIVLISSKVTGTGDDTTGEGQCYDWFASTAVEGEYFGKANGITPDYNWVNETSSCGTGWLKVYYQSKTPSIDFTFDSTSSGFGFGATGNEWRWQSFTSTASESMESVEIRVTKLSNNTADSGLEKPNNLIVALFAADSNGLPEGDPLVQTVVQEETIESKVAMEVPLSYELQEGVRYVIAMTMETPLSLHGGYDCYGWATSSNIEAAEGEKFGKTNNGNDVNNITNNNWVTEALGTGYLKINYEGSVDEPYAYRIELSSDKSIIAIGETVNLSAIVYDQYGNLMDDQVVTYSTDDVAIATVSGNVVTAAGSGTAVIHAKCGQAAADISIAVKDGSGMIEPAPGIVITDDIKFKPGTYDFASANLGIIIEGSGITVDGTDVIIRNASLDSTTEDVTSGAYAYQLNPVSGSHKYSLTRKIDLSDAANISFSYDSKSENFQGAVKVYVSTDGTAWNELSSQMPSDEWDKTTVDLSSYSGSIIYIRIAYENTTDVPADMTLKIDTIELYEDGVRTFSDMAESKVYYWWDASYDDGTRVSDSLTDKPFDRTEYTISTSSYKGTGIYASDVSNVTIKGFTLSGFKDAMYISNCSNMTITENDMSNNYTDPGGGWGDQYGGALTLEYVENSTITNNVANNNANGIYMKYSNNNTITDNVFSICSDVCLEMWNSSNNDIRNNDFSWGIRIDAYDEVHARDSTSQLMESGSNYNYFYRNDFTHGGDGIFIRVGNGWSCEGNVFEENDASFANNNAVESWAGRNYFIRNKANYSSYGFWLGGTDESEVLYNEVAYNGVMPCNAAERGAGNGGIVYLNGTAEHIKIVGNYVHDNNGSGIAVRYDVSATDGYVAGHILIQNNRIENTTKGSGNGDAIYLDSVDWVEISSNQMTGNVNNGVYQASSGVYPVTNVIERDGDYLDSEEAYDAAVPVAVITTDKEEYMVDEAVTFSAAGSTSPSGKALTYRWSMGDGYGPDATIKTGSEVTFMFEEPGYYDVAVTVTDGTRSDIAWINVNVVANGEEIGTDDDASNWSGNVTSNESRGKTYEALLPGVAKYVDYSNYYTISGNQSIYLESVQSNNMLSYPATKDLGADFSKDYALSLSVKIFDERNWWSKNSPTIRLYTDTDNYFTYQANATFLSPLYYADLGCGQWRTEWVPLYIPYSGDSLWQMTKTGSPDLANINYIEIVAETSGDGTYLWVDGMKSVYTGDPEAYFGPDLSVNETPLASSNAEDSVPEGPLAENINETNRWISEAGESGYYGVEYSAERYVDRAEIYLSIKSSDGVEIDLPNDYTLEYLYNGEWLPVTNLSRPVKIKSGANTVTFDLVCTKALRIVFTQDEDKAISVYGFKTLNSENYAAEMDYEGNLYTKVESTISVDALLESVDLVINVNDTSAWPDEYHDFLVYLSAASADGLSPTGPALASGIVTKDEISEKGFGVVYNIPMTTPDGGQLALSPGTKYVLCATQAVVNPDKVAGVTAGSHYRWSAASGIVAGEQAGKLTGVTPDNLAGYGENLGTLWMRIHTDKDDGEKAYIDYSWEPLPTTGYGLGHAGEPGRYQTFTTPVDVVKSVVDGKISEGNGWSTEGEDEENLLTLKFNEVKNLQCINIFFEEGKVPETFSLMVDGNIIKEVTDVNAGFNLVIFDEIMTDNISVVVAPNVVVREIEAMGALPVEPERIITGIEILKSPDKVTYVIGESLDVTGGKIKANYSDGTAEEIEMTAEMVTGFDSQTAGVKTLTVTYEGYTAAFTVNITEAPVTIESIAVTKEPNKTSYVVGDDLDLTGLEITATYSDGSTAVITGYSISGYDKTKPGSQTITVEYAGKTAAFVVTVVEKAAAELESIEILKSPDKVTYVIGESLDVTGGKIKANYSDGTAEEIEMTAAMVTGFDSQTAGIKTLTVTYEGYTAAFTVNITEAPVTIESIAVTKEPNKTSYVVGDDLDLTGLEITATYSDGSTAVITGYSISGYDKTKPGSQTITVEYAGKTAQFKVNVSAKKSDKDTPKSGDFTPIVPLMIVMIIAILAIVILRKKMRIK